MDRSRTTVEFLNLMKKLARDLEDVHAAMRLAQDPEDQEAMSQIAEEALQLGLMLIKAARPVKMEGDD